MAPPAIPKNLLDAIMVGRCVAFAGSGLSAPCGLPSWRELVSTMCSQVVHIDPTSSLELVPDASTDDLIRAAQTAKAELGELAYSDTLLRVFRGVSEPHLNHFALARIPFRAVVTTNYDKLLETAYVLQHRVLPIVFSALSISATASVMLGSQYFIFKLHGDVDHPESIVLTREDYDRMVFRSPHVKSFLHAIFSQNTVLFLGYGLNDPDFDLLLTELAMNFDGAIPPHYALLPSPDTHKASDLRKRLNIRVLPYEPAGDHAAVTEFLDSILEHVNPSPGGAP